MRITLGQLRSVIREEVTKARRRVLRESDELGAEEIVDRINMLKLNQEYLGLDRNNKEELNSFYKNEVNINTPPSTEIDNDVFDIIYAKDLEASEIPPRRVRGGPRPLRWR